MKTLTHVFAECRTYSDIACTHNHSFAQLIFPLQGTLFIETPRHDFELDDSRLFFLPPDCSHTFFANDNNKFLVLDVPNHVLPNPVVCQSQGGVSPLLDERWRAIRYLMLSEAAEGSTTDPALSNLFRYAYRFLSHKVLPLSIQYIHDYFHKPLELQQLAQMEGYNLTYYCDWFKKKTGLTPKLYIQRLRLIKAKQLLEQTDLSILEIAQQVGYEHHSSLTRLFQQQEDVSPLAYRRLTRKSAK